MSFAQNGTAQVFAKLAAGEPALILVLTTTPAGVFTLGSVIGVRNTAAGPMLAGRAVAGQSEPSPWLERPARAKVSPQRAAGWVPRLITSEAL